MIDQKTRELVAKEIAAIAVFMRERQFSFCLCSGDMTEEEKNDFINTFTEFLNSSYKAHQTSARDQMVSENKEQIGHSSGASQTVSPNSGSRSGNGFS